jgi:hypothetical protein
MLSHYGRQKCCRQTYAKQNIFKICKLFKRWIHVIFDKDFTQHSIKTHLSKVVRGKNRFFKQLGHLSSAQRNEKNNGQLEKVIKKIWRFFSLEVLNTFTF